MTDANLNVLEPLDMLRSLDIYAGNRLFLRLAGRSLESLSFKIEEYGAQAEPEEVVKLGTLRALTRLELEEFNSTHSLAEIHSLPLRELSLIACLHREDELFNPGALTSLERLHIQDAFVDRLSWLEEGTEGDQLLVVGEMILGLPHLREFSGKSKIFDIGMRNRLQAWQCSPYTNPKRIWEAIFLEGHHKDMKIWTKS